jgi:hypothetical protein
MNMGLNIIDNKEKSNHVERFVSFLSYSIVAFRPVAGQRPQDKQI